MASMTMTASFLGGPTSIVSHGPAASRRRLVVASAGRGAEGEKVRMNVEAKPKSSNGRRDLMFAAAAAAAVAVCSVAGIATAEVPKAGTAEARKFYAPVCVTMPTAKICHK